MQVKGFFLGGRRLHTRSLKSGLVLPTQIFGLFGPPKKCINFDKLNQRQKCVFCVLTALNVSKQTIPVLVSVFNEIFNFSVSHLFVKYFLSFQLFVFSALWSSLPFELPSFLVSKLFGPPNFLWSSAHVRRVRRPVSYTHLTLPTKA